MSEGTTPLGLSTLEQVAHVTSVIGKGGGYIAICTLLSVYCLTIRARSGQPLLGPVFSGLERLTWSLWSYWVFGTLLNQALKFSIRQPRPWWVDPSLPPLSPHPSMGFGMPSGHAQGAVGLWLLAYLCVQLNAEAPRPRAHGWLKLTTLICVIWVPLTMWARVTLHAHSAAQVLAGMSLGLVWAVVLSKLTQSAKAPLALSVMTALCLGALLYHLKAPPQLPEAWLGVIRAHTHEPLWFQPKVKVLLGLSVAAAGLIWAGARDVKARSAEPTSP